MSEEIQLLTVGSWAIFDHIINLPKMPLPGETVNISSPITEIDHFYWGGCSFNSAVTAAKLGLSAGVLAVEGRDFISKGYKDYLENLGVDVSEVIVIRNERSGHGFLLIDRDGNSIVLGNLGAALQQKEQEPNVDIIKNSQGLIVAPTFDEFTLKACKLGKHYGRLVAVNGSLSTWPDIALDFVNNIDTLFCNEFEMISLAKLLSINSIEEIFNFGISALFITLGAEGCRVKTKQIDKIIHGVEPDNFLDQTGAGDSFAGATMSGIVLGYDYETAAKIGNIVGSFVVEAKGSQTNLPDWDQMAKRFEENYGEHLMKKNY